MKIDLDFETYSPADLLSVGAFKYAEHPDTRILLAAVSVNDEPPVLWSCLGPEYDILFGPNWNCKQAVKIMKLWKDPTFHVYAHNSQFEMAISHFRLLKDIGVDPPDHAQWRCTQTMARALSIPARLKTCAEFLGLENQKEARGMALIRKFSVPRKDGSRLLPQDALEDFNDFGEYCLQDVRAEQEVHRKLKKFELKGLSLGMFKADIRMNWEGIPVDIHGLKNADRLLSGYEKRMTKKFVDIVGLNPTQVTALLAFLKKHGYEKNDLTAKSVLETIENPPSAMPEKYVEALKIRYSLSFSSIKKIKTMRACAMEDGRVRGGLISFGAHTGRSAGRLIQPQNFKRPTLDDGEGIYESLTKDETLEYIDAFFGDPFEAASSCVRHFIRHPTKKLFDADYSGAEARIVHWIADEQEHLDDFRANKDVYVVMASKIYGVKESAVTKDQRFVGKQAVLGAGYQLAWRGFKVTCKNYGQEISDELAERTIRTFRRSRSKLTKFWYELDRCFKASIKRPNKLFQVGKHIKLFSIADDPFPATFIRLPSGRKLCYPLTRIRPSQRFNDDEIQYYAQIPNKSFWGHISTYGGKLTENITQAICADIMAIGSINAIQRGIVPFMIVHDEALAVEKGDYKDFEDALTDLPPGWFDGLPIVAEGGVVDCYTKD